MNVNDKHGDRYPLAYLGKDAPRRPAVIRSGSGWYTAGYVQSGIFHSMPEQNGSDLDSLIGLANRA